MPQLTFSEMRDQVKENLHVMAPDISEVRVVFYNNNGFICMEVVNPVTRQVLLQGPEIDKVLYDDCQYKAMLGLLEDTNAAAQSIVSEYRHVERW